MYPFIKVSGRGQKRFFNICITIVCVLLGLYYVLSGAELQLNGYIIKLNTEAVASDETKLRVEHISSDGTLYLEDTTSVPDEDVTSYIRTVPGSGVYYIPGEGMSAEITRSDALQLGTRFMVLDSVVFLMFSSLVFWKGYRKHWIVVFLIVYGVCTFFTDIVMKYYCVSLLQSSFPIQWAICGRYLVFVVIALFAYRRSKSKNVK